MARFFIGSNFHSASNLHAATADPAANDPLASPPNVVLGFRTIFWSVFTRVLEVAKPSEPIDWFEKKWRIESIFIFESAQADDRLGTEDENHLILVIEIIPVDGGDQLNLNDEMFRRGLTEQQFVRDLVQAITLVDKTGVLASLTHDRDLPARFYFSTAGNLGNRLQANALFAFKFFCQLLLWQIEREQISQRITDDIAELGPSMEKLLTIRKKLINIERLFFTRSISNNREAKLLVHQLRERLQLNAKFTRLPAINESLERYYDLRSQLELQRQSESLNHTALAIAGLGLPISVMSMLLAIDLKAPVLTSPDSLFSVPQIQLFLVLSAAGSIIALILLAAVFALNAGPITKLFRGTQKKRSKRGSRPRKTASNSIATKRPPAT